MNIRTLPLGALAMMASATTFADHHNTDKHHFDEEIVVSAPFQKKSSETVLPVNVLTGEALRKDVESSIGATLKDQIGIHNESFGPGVGRPVIRGQTGNRVQVMQNSVNNVDASSVSPDHVNAVEPLLANRVEVVRGPSTLLYGNGAVGGIVNVIDERIPEHGFERTAFAIEQSHATVNEENKTVAKLDATIGRINVHLDGFERDGDAVDIPGFAIDEAALDDHEEDEAHEEDEEHEEEVVNSRGFIANSEARADGFTLGASVSGDRGFIGLSVSGLTSEYGLPPGAHGHEEDEEHEEHEEHEEAEEEGQEFVRIDMEQSRHDFSGELRIDGRFFRRLRGSVNVTDYEHTELEIEPDGSAIVGTRFRNEGAESRFTLTHAPLAGWTGVWGLQLTDTEFSAMGEEAFIPETGKDGMALFAIERLESGRATWELGFRVERNELDPGGNCGRDETTGSVSASLLYDVRSDSNVLIALSRSERAPTIEERYSNVDAAACRARADSPVLHASTGLFEIGNPDLGVETATNLELGYRKHAGGWTSALSAYYNRIDDYIYLLETTEEVAHFLAEDATFYGIEGRLEYPVISNDRGELQFRLQGDYVRAEFDGGGDLPRIPPARLGVGLAYRTGNWSVDLGLQEVFDQKDTAVGEAATDGYTLLSLYADYHIAMGDSELVLFARGSNLLDEEVRNHASFLKQFAPEAGRNLRVGIRYVY